MPLELSKTSRGIINGVCFYLEKEHIHLNKWRQYVLGLKLGFGHNLLYHAIGIQYPLRILYACFLIQVII